MSRLDYDWIVQNRLAQGGLVSRQNAVQIAPEIWKQFHILVLCAEEIQPRIRTPDGRKVFRIPFDDDIYRPIPREAAALFHQAAHELARYVRGGAKVLVTCAQGRNRSGLINALVLQYAFGSSPREAINTIRAKRSRDALANPIFENWLLNSRVRMV